MSVNYQDGNASTIQPVEEVETAMPAFIGYTARAQRKAPGDLLLVPTKIGSMREYEHFFGYPFENEMQLSVSTDGSGRFCLDSLREAELKYLLWYSLRIYFDNGGGPCYIVSVDTYSNPQQVVLRGLYGSRHYGLLDGLNKLAGTEEVTLIVFPEAVKLRSEEYAILVQAALMHCHLAGNRFAILDIYNGECPNPDLNRDRSLFGNKCLEFGSAYYSFLKTKMNHYVSPDGRNVLVKFEGEETALGYLRKKNFQLYKFVRKELYGRYVVLPPSGAVAGIYVTTDHTRGVWKSPANVTLNGVSEPMVDTDNQLYDMFTDSPETGKSINNIRFIENKGILLLGARTLSVHDGDTKYIPVRRFILMVEASLKRSTSWAVFEPNDPVTWSRICQITETYLTLKWQEGALAGANPSSAFYVKCGIGETMTEQDLLEGTIRVEIGLAMLRASEFTVLSLVHRQKAAAVTLQIA